MDEPLLSFIIVKVCTVAAPYVPCQADSAQGPGPGAPPPPADASPPICIAVVPMYPYGFCFPLEMLCGSQNSWISAFLLSKASPRVAGQPWGPETLQLQGHGLWAAHGASAREPAAHAPHPTLRGLAVMRAHTTCPSVCPFLGPSEKRICAKAPCPGRVPRHLIVSGTPLRTQSLENTHFHFCTSPPELPPAPRVPLLA